MNTKLYHDYLDDSGRAMSAQLVCAVFDAVSQPDTRREPAPLFKAIDQIALLGQVAPFMFGAALHEIGLLAGTSHAQYGTVSTALRLTGDALRDNYLQAQTPTQYRRCQDGAHVLLHLANAALPARAAGAHPDDIAPLRRSFQLLAEDASYAHVIALSGVVLQTLDWRQQSYALGQRAGEPITLPEQTQAVLHAAAPLYEDAWKSSVSLISNLALQKMAQPG